jgi:hypothetical protein
VLVLKVSIKLYLYVDTNRCCKTYALYAKIQRKYLLIYPLLSFFKKKTLLEEKRTNNQNRLSCTKFLFLFLASLSQV